MKIGIFAPYGPHSQESGVMYLLGNYLKDMFPDVVQLQCNGSFSVCERDSESSWKRDFNACMSCMADQSHLQKWSGLSSIQSSSFLSPTDIESSKRLLHKVPDSALKTFEYEGQVLFDLCAESFQKRVGAAFDARNRRHIQVARMMITSVLRMRRMSASFVKSFVPDMCFVASGKDLLSKSFLSSLDQTSVESVCFRWNMHRRSIDISRSSTEEKMSCDLLLDGISNMRPNQHTWPKELTAIIDEILEFLDLKQTQLRLPMGRVSNG